MDPELKKVFDNLGGAVNTGIDWFGKTTNAIKNLNTKNAPQAATAAMLPGGPSWQTIAMAIGGVAAILIGLTFFRK